MLWIANPASPVRLRIAPPLFLLRTDVKALRPSGEIGRHNRFKICRSFGRAGSSPASGTILKFQEIQERLKTRRNAGFLYVFSLRTSTKILLKPQHSGHNWGHKFGAVNGYK